MPRRGAGYTVARLSGDSGSTPTLSIAVFAHNEARRIRSALESVVAGAAGTPISVVVLANGCSDRTADEVRACADRIADLTLVEIAMADKANPWNVYVHDFWSDEEIGTIATHFFMDGDVRVEPEALSLLASAFLAAPTVDAAGAMPISGRDRDAWRQRMVRNSSLAGNLYALRRAFVAEIRERHIRMPIGLFGEDRFVSWLVFQQLGDGPATDGLPRCAFHPSAGFSFDSLSPWRVRDYRTYLRRLWRYARRGVQHEMLLPMLRQRGLAALPVHVEEVYRRGPIPSRLRWIGRGSALRTLAVQWVRRYRRRGSAS